MTPMPDLRKALAGARTWCPECGYGVAVDQDGCCVMCGATAIGRGADQALALLAAAPQDAGLRDQIAQMVDELRDVWKQYSYNFADRILALLPSPDALREAFVACAKWLDEEGGMDAKAMLAGGAEAEALRRWPKEETP